MKNCKAIFRRRRWGLLFVATLLSDYKHFARGFWMGFLLHMPFINISVHSLLNDVTFAPLRSSKSVMVP